MSGTTSAHPQSRKAKQIIRKRQREEKKSERKKRRLQEAKPNSISFSQKFSLFFIDNFFLFALL